MDNHYKTFYEQVRIDRSSYRVCNKHQTVFFCSGLRGACIYIASDITIQKYFLKRRSLANGIAVTASGIGVFTWPLLARCIIDHYEWNGACLIMGKRSRIIGVFLVYSEKNSTKNYSIWSKLFNWMTFDIYLKIYTAVSNAFGFIFDCVLIVFINQWWLFFMFKFVKVLQWQLVIYLFTAFSLSAIRKDPGNFHSVTIISFYALFLPTSWKLMYSLNEE